MNNEIANMEKEIKQQITQCRSQWQVTTTLFTEGEGFLQVIPSV